MDKTIRRCGWAGDDPLYQRYHDEEWGVPCFDDGRLFEMLILEGAQAGLSWITVLRKRENYRRALDDFDAGKIACYGDAKVDELMNNPGIIRNRLKLVSTIRNARAYLNILEQFGSFSDFIWRYVDGTPVQNRWSRLSQVPAATDISALLSRDLKRLGFNFVGSTICYAYMQSIGMVNDHTTDCFRHSELGGIP